jgi:hypothetical protein
MNSDNSAEEYRSGYRDARLAVNPESLDEKEVRGFQAQTERRGGGTMIVERSLSPRPLVSKAR